MYNRILHKPRYPTVLKTNEIVSTYRSEFFWQIPQLLPFSFFELLFGDYLSLPWRCVLTLAKKPCCSLSLGPSAATVRRRQKPRFFGLQIGRPFNFCRGFEPGFCVHWAQNEARSCFALCFGVFRSIRRTLY